MAKIRPLLPTEFHGWICLHKPIGPTSFDMVRQVKRLLPRKTKIGHGGTLDPLASGVLPIAIGEATKTVDYLMHEKKEYVFDVAWGAQTNTDDAEFIANEDNSEEGVVLFQSDDRPTLEDIQKILPQFTGPLDQLPPLYSAKKIEGKRACDLMREGIEVELNTSPITVFSLEVISHAPDMTKFKALVSKGTYVRSLARDMGKVLGCYGHAASILRSKVGGMTLESGYMLEKLVKFENNGILSKAILPIQAVLADIPAVLVIPDQERLLRYGQVVESCDIALMASETKDSKEAYALCVSHEEDAKERRAIAIVEVLKDDDKTSYSLKPKRVFNI